MITFCYNEMPPLPEELGLICPDGTVKKEWGYGGYLLDRKFKHISQELRHLVALCLYDNPTHRPSMAELQETIGRLVKREGPKSERDIGHPEQSFWATSILSNYYYDLAGERAFLIPYQHLDIMTTLAGPVNRLISLYNLGSKKGSIIFLKKMRSNPSSSIPGQTSQS
ncbi:hypothetical protein B0H67DRAFT_125564 [Lasiosphaeris hirsuta]|uniref:Uncharacterized protein n=1 Tax=Lasiosphaeris hirsuta TaxID=260670 RepID=A0AA40B0C2_9PEZI|nr:hypothetical protein B0H67DRAFT_125564 [Lasiosphaeris hirsuta]